MDCGYIVPACAFTVNIARFCTLRIVERRIHARALAMGKSDDGIWASKQELSFVVCRRCSLHIVR